MYWTRFAVMAFIVAAFLVGGGRLILASGADSVGQAALTISPSATPTASQGFLLVTTR